MKRTFASVLTALLLVGMCVAQGTQQRGSGSVLQGTSGSASQPNARAAPSASQLQVGTTLQAELLRPVDARRNKAGDEVLAKVTHDVKAGGSVVISKGANVVGRVTEVKIRSKDQETSEVRIVFDRAVLKNGTEIPLVLTLQAIGARPVPPGETSEMASGTTTVAPGGLLGGIGSTTTGAASDVGGAARSVDLAPTSQGVVGLHGLTLSNQTSASVSARGSVIRSNNDNVRLDGGTQMILRISQ
jgi:hypothetical protein